MTGQRVVEHANSSVSTTPVSFSLISSGCIFRPVLSKKAEAIRGQMSL